MASGDDDATWFEDDASASSSSSSSSSAHLLVGRYELGPLIGRGGSGQVHRAHDRLTDTDVAVKFVRSISEGEARQLRRELTALRLLDLPGVVHLLDDGVDQGQTFLVMDLLPGGTFDTLAQQGPWATWREQAIALLESLARVHFAGVVHRDLKPGNILLDAKGYPVLTDFGLAMGRAVEDPGAGWREGTPRYMAPEQRRGEPCDARTDLFALGVMLEEMLSHADVPHEVDAVVQAMTSPDPQARPASAVRVIEALGASTRALLGSVAALPEVATAKQLRALYDEPEVSFLHLAEDAAIELHDRTEGRRADVQAELDRWVRAGRCHWERERVVITRNAIAALQWEREPARAELARALASGAPSAEGDALERALAAHAVGDTARGLAILEAVAGPGEGPVAVAVVDLSLALQRVEQLKRASYLAQRHGWAEGRSLLAAAREALHGDPARGLEELEALGPLQDGTLEGWRLAVGIYSASHVSPSRVPPWRAQAESWAGRDRRRLARMEMWWGRVAYAEGRFEDARRHEQAALAGATTPAERLLRLTTTAAAAMEEPDLDVAQELATEARALAMSLRHPLAECRATWLLRSSAYRAGRALPAQAVVVEAALRVSPGLAAQLAVTEAAAAWRAGALELGGALAHRARTLFEGLRFPDGRVLSQALAVVCGTGAALTAGELSECHPRIAAQAAALCAIAGQPIDDLVVTWSDEQLRSARMDVLTGQECLSALSSEV